MLAHLLAHMAPQRRGLHPSSAAAGSLGPPWPPPGCVRAPTVTTDLSEALRLLRSDGAVIVEWAACGEPITQATAEAILPAVFGDSLRCAMPASSKR
eukprot:SAG11_NODE_16183_length_555_cov_0.631579_1_plen_96_part_10